MNKFISFHLFLVRKFHLINIFIGFLVAIFKYLSCYSFSCALSCFLTSVLIGSLVFIVYKSIAGRIVSKKLESDINSVKNVIDCEPCATHSSDKIDVQDVEELDVKEV